MHYIWTNGLPRNRKKIVPREYDTLNDIYFSKQKKNTNRIVDFSKTYPLNRVKLFQKHGNCCTLHLQDLVDQQISPQMEPYTSEK